MKIKGIEQNFQLIKSPVDLLASFHSQGVSAKKLLDLLGFLLAQKMELNDYLNLVPDSKEIVGAATLSRLSLFFFTSKKKRRLFWIQQCHRPWDFRWSQKKINLFSRSSVHTQFQIVGNPSWNFEEMNNFAIEIVSWLGLDPTNISCPKDDWSSPSILAYGKGFEVRYRGVEIMQATIFKSYLGLDLNPGCHELVIGLERLLWCCLNERNKKVNMIHYPGQDKFYRKIHKSKDKKIWKNYLIKFMRLICLSNPNWNDILEMNHTFNILNLNPFLNGLDRLYLQKGIQKSCFKFKSNYLS